MEFSSRPTLLKEILCISSTRFGIRTICRVQFLGIVDDLLRYWIWKPALLFIICHIHPLPCYRGDFNERRREERLLAEAESTVQTLLFSSLFVSAAASVRLQYERDHRVTISPLLSSGLGGFESSSSWRHSPSFPFSGFALDDSLHATVPLGSSPPSSPRECIPPLESLVLSNESLSIVSQRTLPSLSDHERCFD
jgi:hypothetical protein